MGLSEDPCKSWLLEKACKGLNVPDSLCEALLSEDQAQIDLSTFLKGGRLHPSYTMAITTIRPPFELLVLQALDLLYSYILRSSRCFYQNLPLSLPDTLLYERPP